VIEFADDRLNGVWEKAARNYGLRKCANIVAESATTYSTHLRATDKYLSAAPEIKRNAQGRLVRPHLDSKSANF